MKTIEEERDFYKAQAENMQADLKATEDELDAAKEQIEKLKVSSDMYAQWWHSDYDKCGKIEAELNAANERIEALKGVIEKLEQSIDDLKEEYIDLHLRERYKAGAVEAYENALSWVFADGVQE